MSLPLVCSCRNCQFHCFDDELKKPCTGSCGHTVCQQCITVHGFSTCSVCGLDGAFSKISVNYTSIALIEECRKRFLERWKRQVNTKNPGIGFYSMLFEEFRLLCSMCIEPVKIPRICLTCDQETLFKRNRWQWKQNSAIIPKLLQRVICSNCALENHGGKEHKVVKAETKKSKKFITMAIVHQILDIIKDAMEYKGATDCVLRRLKIEIIGQILLKIFGELEYVEEWECGYLGELIKQELIKKYIENIDEKMLDLFGTEGNEICDCSRLHKKPDDIFSKNDIYMEFRRLLGKRPQVFESGCPLYSWKYMDNEFSGVAEKLPPNDSTCPLCLYNGQHQKKDFFLESGMSTIEELCRTEMIPLEKCCLRCLDRLNDCQLLFSCEYVRESDDSNTLRKNHIMKNDLEQFGKRKRLCHPNCFIKDSTLWNFVIINHMMADDNLYEVIMHKIEQTVGFVDCQLRKVRMKQTVIELYNGLHRDRAWKDYGDWPEPVEMGALFKSFKQQWNYFRFGNGEQKAASQCKCTVIWNKILGKKMKKEKYEALETTMINMTRYSMTEEIHGCPMRYSHGIEFNKDGMEELEDAVGVKFTGGEETELTLVGDEQKCFKKNIASNIFPFAQLYCQNEEIQLFDDEENQPFTGSCGHTICLWCAERTSNGDCPVCGKEKSFQGDQLNEFLVQEIETIKQNAWEMFKELWNSETADSGACSECNKMQSSSDLFIPYSGKFIIGDDKSCRLRTKTTPALLELSRRIQCNKCVSVSRSTVKVNSIRFWKQHLKKTNGIFLLELLYDEIERRGENCEHLRSEIQTSLRELFKVLEELNYERKEDCEYDRELIKQKLVEALIENIDQNMKQLSIFTPDEIPCEPVEERNCPMCVMIDYLDYANNRSEHNRNHWINVFEHFWSNQTPAFENCCIRCLLFLDHRYSTCCLTDIQVLNVKKMNDAIFEGIEKEQLKNFQQGLTSKLREDFNRFLDDDKEIWQNLIIREFFFCLLQIITEGLSKTSFPCRLRKLRIYNLAHHFLSEICNVWLMNNHNWNVCWKSIKTSSMVKNLNLQLKKLKDEMDKEKIGVKCECTRIWERNQNIISKFGHEECEDKREHQDLEDSMEKMARFSLDKDLDGCPMDYDHGIELEVESVRKLKEATDSDAQVNKDKCLCMQIDSIGPETAISSADFEHIVSCFINWWKYESSYPHLLCHICIDRLELVLELFWKLHESHHCSWEVLKTFLELGTSIYDFQLTKGRVSEREMEKMTKLFDGFISEWNSVQLPSDPCQQFLEIGTECDCKGIKGEDHSRKSRKRCAENRFSGCPRTQWSPCVHWIISKNFHNF